LPYFPLSAMSGGHRQPTRLWAPAGMGRVRVSRFRVNVRRDHADTPRPSVARSSIARANAGESRHVRAFAGFRNALTCMGQTVPRESRPLAAAYPGVRVQLWGVGSRRRGLGGARSTVGSSPVLLADTVVGDYVEPDLETFERWFHATSAWDVTRGGIIYLENRP